MSNHNTIFYSIMKFIHRTGAFLPDIRLFKTFGWAVVGLIMSQKPHFSYWQIYRTESSLASSKARQFSRWLHNDRIKPLEIYHQIIRAMLRQWIDQEIYLALDTSQLWNKFLIVRISLIYCNKAIPLSWFVCESKSATIAFARYESLIKEVSKLIPSTCTVIFLGDRAFGTVPLYKLLKKLKWHFRIRLKCSTLIHETPRQSRRKIQVTSISNLMPQKGNAAFMNHIWVSEKRYGPLYLAMAHVITKQGVEKWAIISDQKVTRRTFDEYGLRFCIEENFLDDKSAGFNLEDSELKCTEAISRLCLIIATATIYLVSTGKAIDDLGHRKQVDTHWFRGLSYLQIGWRWCKQAVFKNKWLLDFIWIEPDPNYEPSIASWKQFYRPMYEIKAVEFL